MVYRRQRQAWWTRGRAGMVDQRQGRRGGPEAEPGVVDRRQGRHVHSPGSPPSAPPVDAAFFRPSWSHFLKLALASRPDLTGS